MKTMTSSQFDEILNHKFDHSKYDYLFYNVERNQLLEIKRIIQERKITNIVDIIVDIDPNELRKMEYMISTVNYNIESIRYLILSTYLSTLICRELFDYQLLHNEFVDVSLTPNNVLANENLKNCENIKEYTEGFNHCDTFDWDNVQSFIQEHRKRKFVFHFFITKEMKNEVLQREINHYVGQYNGIFHTRIYTESESLISYYNSFGQPIQIGHDYYDFDGIENSSILKPKKLH